MIVIGEGGRETGKYVQCQENRPFENYSLLDCGVLTAPRQKNILPFCFLVVCRGIFLAITVRTGWAIDTHLSGTDYFKPPLGQIK